MNRLANFGLPAERMAAKKGYVDRLAYICTKRVSSERGNGVRNEFKREGTHFPSDWGFADFGPFLKLVPVALRNECTESGTEVSMNVEQI